MVSENSGLLFPAPYCSPLGQEGDPRDQRSSLLARPHCLSHCAVCSSHPESFLLAIVQAPVSPTTYDQEQLEVVAECAVSFHALPQVCNLLCSYLVNIMFGQSCLCVLGALVPGRHTLGQDFHIAYTPCK